MEAKAAYETTDQRLNELYQKILNDLNGQQETLFRQAGRAWVDYKQAQCEAATKRYEGGSMQPLVRYSCLDQITESRIETLRCTHDSSSAPCE